MKDLQVGTNGDLIIAGNDLQFVKDTALTTQKIRLVLGTNKNEWLLDSDEGINFRAFLVKNPNQDEIIDTVRDGLRQIDESLEITEYSFETKQRHMILTFKAVNGSGEEMSFVMEETGESNENNWLIRALADLVEVD